MPRALGPVRLITSDSMAKYDNREDHQSDFTDRPYGDPCCSLELLVALDLDGGFGAVWVFGHLGRFSFSFVIWSVREFSYFEICFASFCSDFKKFIFSFSVCLKISAKFLLFYCTTCWIFTQEI